MAEPHPQPEGRQGDPQAGETPDDVDPISDDSDVDGETENGVEDLDVDDETEHIRGASMDGKGNDPYPL